MWKKILIITGGLLILLLGFLWWYKATYSMQPAQPFTVNQPEATPRILIAYQGSDYKHQLVDAVLEHFGEAYVKGIDISTLEAENPTDWDAVLLCHTWENWAPPKAVETFFERHANASNVVVVTTSDNGGYQMENVDAITTASVVEQAPEDAKRVIQRLESLL